MILLSEILLLLPEITLLLFAFVILFTDMFTNKQNIGPTIASFGVGISALSVLLMYLGLFGSTETSSLALANIISVDHYSLFFKLVMLIVALSLCLCSISLFDEDVKSRGEFWTLFLLSLIGMIMLPSTTEMITTWVALELTSLPIVGMLALSEKKYSLEVALKYLVLGATSSAIILMGIAYLYGITGSTFFSDIASVTTGQIESRYFSSGSTNLLLLFSVILLVAGVSFKIASFPFFSWVPDVYQGAPTLVTIYLSVVSKIAGFAILIRILFEAVNRSSASDWAFFIAIMSLISMILGNIMAIRQVDIKRLFAYSTIAHAGYILIGVASIKSSASIENNLLGLQSTIFYLVAYAVTNLTGFLCILSISEKIKSTAIEDFSGIGFSLKSQAVILSISLISLLGIPTTIGFMGKAFIFSSAISNGFYWLAIAGIVNSIISAYYYVRIIKIMFIDEPKDSHTIVRSNDIYSLVVTSLGVVIIFIIGLAPVILLDIVESVVNSFV